MGLDMSLSKKTYIGNNFAISESNPRGFKPMVEIGIPALPHIKQERVTEITEQVGYWRKANHIHAWFVKNVQDGKDECQDSCVSREQLKELRDVCQQALDAPENAPEILPTQSGFFFGGTEYDEYYFDDVRQTVEIIDNALAEEYSGDFYYRASW